MRAFAGKAGGGKAHFPAPQAKSVEGMESIHALNARLPRWNAQTWFCFFGSRSSVRQEGLELSRMQFADYYSRRGGFAQGDAAKINVLRAKAPSIRKRWAAKRPRGLTDSHAGAAPVRSASPRG